MLASEGGIQTLPRRARAVKIPQEDMTESDEPEGPIHLSRRQRLRSSHSYGFVLLLLVATFMFAATAPNEEWSTSVLLLIQAGTLGAAIWTSGLTPRGDVVAGLLLIVGGALATAQLAWGSDETTGTIGIVNMVLLAATIVAIGLGVLDQGSVNAQSVLGALCIYLSIGLFYTFTYGAIAVLGSGPFFAQGTDGGLAERVYFSFVTMTTVGYGDYSAAGDLGRTLAVTEALLGQIYLVTVVGVIVSRLRPRRTEGEE
jgi:Ion channel